jgi:hypothetical protein
MLSTGTAASKISILLVFVITTREQLHQRLGVLVDQLSELWVVGRELLDDRLEVRWVLLDELVEEVRKKVSGRLLRRGVAFGKSSQPGESAACLASLRDLQAYRLHQHREQHRPEEPQRAQHRHLVERSLANNDTRSVKPSRSLL